MNLREQVLKAAAGSFSARMAMADAIGETPNKKWELACKAENARLTPLIEALAECAYNLNHNVTWLERMSGLQWDNPEYAPNFKAHAERSRESLAKLEALLKEGV